MGSQQSGRMVLFSLVFVLLCADVQGILDAIHWTCTGNPPTCTCRSGWTGQNCDQPCAVAPQDRRGCGCAGTTQDECAGAIQCFYSKPATVSTSKATRNIRQWWWENIKDFKTSGVIKNVTFHKNSDSTALRLVWNGGVVLHGYEGSESQPSNGNACRRWYFMINGQECSSPGTIDAMLMARPIGAAGFNDHRPMNLEGLCMDIPADDVEVAFHIGGCPLISPACPPGSPVTGAHASSRLIVEELDVQ